MYKEVGTGKYGDPSCRVVGVIGASIEQPGKESTLITRLHTWTVQRSGLAVINAAEAQASHDRSLRKGPNADFYLAYDAMEAAKFERSGEAASTWTRVNNCTDKQGDRRHGVTFEQVIERKAGTSFDSEQIFTLPKYRSGHP